MTYIFQDIRYKTLPDGGLMVVDVTEEDAGDYTCVATNNQASIQDTATVHVFCKYHIVWWLYVCTYKQPDLYARYSHCKCIL